MLLPLLIAVAVGYVLGALPFGYLVARSKGVNIFEVGSKNPGATNVRRVLGSGPGNLVFFLDALKGAVAVGWLQLFWLIAANWNVRPGAGDVSRADEIAVLYCSIAGLVGALLGHSFSCFTSFRGGKGVATATGGLVVLMPLALLVSAAVWFVIFAASRYVSLASILAAAVLPVTAWLLHTPRLLVGIAVAIAAFVVLRHRTNIQRLLTGTEAKFARKPKAQSP
jgi:glycerol-3-phosphate acyltransferase PlsY